MIRKTLFVMLFGLAAACGDDDDDTPDAQTSVDAAGADAAGPDATAVDAAPGPG